VKKVSLCISYLLLLSATISAAPRKGDARTLRGVLEVQVICENLSPDARLAGVTRDHLETVIENRLRRAGVGIVDDIQAAKRRVPSLYVAVNVSSVIGENSFIYSYRVALYEAATLARDPNLIVMAECWQDGGYGIVGARKATSILTHVEECLGRFTDDLVASH